MANSRMKDFYDLWFLTRRFGFNGAIVFAALRVTFERRETAPPTDIPIALTGTFARDESKSKQWVAFLRKTRFHLEPPSLIDLIDQLRIYALPLLDALGRGKEFHETWSAGGPWVKE